MAKWVVTYWCNTAYYDICVQVQDDVDLKRNGNPLVMGGGSDSQLYGLQLKDDQQIRSNDSGGNFEVGQFGVRRNNLGQLFTDADGDLILYFPVGGVGSGARAGRTSTRSRCFSRIDDLTPVLPGKGGHARAVLVPAAAASCQ